MRRLIIATILLVSVALATPANAVVFGQPDGKQAS
ncbi:MAG: hypothetical protein QOH48_513 [Actinomycetota bacterium]|jgi:hypothetical protein|nr:hypothetical protein [Actinomycetota bacterium]